MWVLLKSVSSRPRSTGTPCSWCRGCGRCGLGGTHTEAATLTVKLLCTRLHPSSEPIHCHCTSLTCWHSSGIVVICTSGASEMPEMENSCILKMLPVLLHYMSGRPPPSPQIHVMSGRCQGVFPLLAPLLEASPWHLCRCVVEAPLEEPAAGFGLSTSSLRSCQGRCPSAGLSGPWCPHLHWCRSPLAELLRGTPTALPGLRKHPEAGRSTETPPLRIGKRLLLFSHLPFQRRRELRGVLHPSTPLDRLFSPA